MISRVLVHHFIGFVVLSSLLPGGMIFDKEALTSRHTFFPDITFMRKADGIAFFLSSGQQLMSRVGHTTQLSLCFGHFGI